MQQVTQIIIYNKIISNLIKGLFCTWISKMMLRIFDHHLMESNRWPPSRLIRQNHKVWKITNRLNWTPVEFIRVMLLINITSKVLLCLVMGIVRLIISPESNWRKQSLMKGLLLRTALGHRLIGLCNKISLRGQYQVDRMITQSIKDKIITEGMSSCRTKVVRCKIIILNFILILKLVEVIIQGLLLL